MRVNLTGIAPVHHILRLQDLHTHKVKVAGYHIVFILDTNDVRVAEVCTKYRIPIRTVVLIAPRQNILLYKFRSCIRLFRVDFDIVEMNPFGMSYVEAFGGQWTPHRCLWVFGSLLILKCLINLGYVGSCDTSLLVNTDIADVNVFDRVAW